MNQSGYNPELHHRRSIRLKGHDYAGGGVYFVTLCAHRDAGQLFEDEAAKEILARIWEESCRDALDQDAGGKPAGGADEGADKGGDKAADTRPARTGAPGVCPPNSSPAEKEGRPKISPYCIMPDHFHGLIQIQKGVKALGDFICAFKSRTTNEYIQGVKAGIFPPFRAKIWHRNYYEMIVRSREAEEQIAKYIRMNPWRCVQDFGNGLRGMGNPALWNREKLGVLCSRNALKPKSIPGAAVYLSGFHSPMEKEIFEKLLENRKPLIWCPAWGLDGTLAPAVLQALEENRMLILEMRNTAGNLAAAEERNRLVLERADRLWLPYVQPGGMLERLVRETGKKAEGSL